MNLANKAWNLLIEHGKTFTVLKYFLGSKQNKLSRFFLTNLKRIKLAGFRVELGVKTAKHLKVSVQGI